MDEAFVQAFIKFLQDPSPENFLALRAMVIAAPEYEPYATDHLALAELCKKEHWEAARQLFQDMMPSYLITANVHYTLSFVAKKQGDEQTAKMEADIGSLLLRAQRKSGDGTQAAPYLVTRTDEEYDLLTVLGKKFKSQRLVEAPDRVCDVLLCEDGSEVWFDVTAPYRKLRGSMESNPKN